MPETDLQQPDLGPLRAVAVAAELAPFGSGGTWLVTGDRDQGAQR